MLTGTCDTWAALFAEALRAQLRAEPLTPGDLAALQWVAAGTPRRIILARSGWSLIGLQRHLESARASLAARTLPVAVFHALIVNVLTELHEPRPWLLPEDCAIVQATVADDLPPDRTPRQVRKHLALVRKRWGARTLAHLVTLAWAWRVIGPDQPAPRWYVGPSIDLPEPPNRRPPHEVIPDRLRDFQSAPTPRPSLPEARLTIRLPNDAPWWSDLQGADA